MGLVHKLFVNKCTGAINSPLRVCVELGGVSTISMYDTGSSFNLMSREFFDDLILHECYSGSKVLKHYSGDKPVAAGGHEISILGEVPVPVTVAHVKRIVRFLVTDDIFEPVLLGVPGINLFGTWKYSPKTKCFALRGRFVPLVDLSCKNDDLACFVKSDELIPPRTAKFISLTIPAKNESDSNLLSNLILTFLLSRT